MLKQAAVSVNGKWLSQLKNEVNVRHHDSFVVDEYEEMNGHDAGPNSMEYFLGALASSISATTAKIAKEQGLNYYGLTFSANGDLDPRGYFGAEDVQTYFHTIDVSIEIETAEEPEAIRLLRETVEKRCPLYKLLEDAGVTIRSNWTMKLYQTN